jgi:hypothetical protein
VQSYPKRLAYEYLEELQSEFGRLYGSQVDAAARPYAFIKFGKALIKLCVSHGMQQMCRLSCQHTCFLTCLILLAVVMTQRI